MDFSAFLDMSKQRDMRENQLLKISDHHPKTFRVFPGVQSASFLTSTLDSLVGGGEGVRGQPLQHHVTSPL